jgi:hypothetical protein
MAAYSWPTSLPQQPTLSGYSESMVVNVISTPMDNGPGKTRRRSARPTPIQCTFIMSSAQLVTLEDFVRNTLLCVRRFNFRHPRLETTVEVKIVPANGGEMYKTSPIGGELWSVSIDMEILP